MRFEGRALLDKAGEANFQEDFALLEDEKALRIHYRLTKDLPKRNECS